MPYAKIDASTTGDHTVVAAPAAWQKIRIMNYTIFAAGDVSVTWKSGSTEISGAMPIAANGGLAPSAGSSTAIGPDGVLQCAGGEALVLNLSAPVAVGGHLRYELVTV